MDDETVLIHEALPEIVRVERRIHRCAELNASDIMGILRQRAAKATRKRAKYDRSIR